MNSFTKIAAPVAVIATLALPMAGCSSEKYSLGDCVTATTGISNDKMKKTDCRTSTIEEKLDGDSVYRISEIVDLRAGCPRSTDVTFNDEPTDATYCLIEY